ncbi:MAG: thiamine ABC transporter substrate-binding protein [Actinomycetaceae bacterium]|nr:thiamine ABC transporter substrate-binding protein [Actinomycetaceae bacterium]
MRRVISGLAATFALALVASSCSSSSEPEGAATGEPTAAANDPVVVLAYDSMDFPQELADAFKQKTGFELEIQATGDAGELANKLVLSKDAPLGDVAFGIDNISGYRAVEAGVFAADPVAAPAEVTELGIKDAPGLTAFDHGDVCVNYDKAWFTDNGKKVPATLDDLRDPEYKDLFVAMNPTSSSPGMAFLAATVANYGDQWEQYWKDLKDNGVKITSGWSEAFNVDYSAGEGKGPRPLMLSYSSSPAWSVNDDLTDSSTAALLETCFHQVEYMGVLQGAKNPEGAKAFVEFMLEKESQEAISAANYMHPVVAGAKLPEALEKFGPLAPTTHDIDAQTIMTQQKDWLAKWADIMGQ